MRHVLREIAARKAAQDDPAYAECVEAALPDLTLIGLADAAALRALVYGGDE